MILPGEPTAPSERTRAALRTAELLRRAADITRQQAELIVQRADLSRALAASEEEEAKHTRTRTMQRRAPSG